MIRREIGSRFLEKNSFFFPGSLNSDLLRFLVSETLSKTAGHQAL